MNELKKSTDSKMTVTKYEDLDKHFHSAMQVVDDIVLKNYISKLHDFQIIPLDEKIKQTNLSENVRLFKITEMVYEKNEFSTYKFSSVFNALSTSNCAVFVIMDSDGIKTDFYMGIRSMDSERTTNSLKDTLKNAMMGQFPGIKTQEYLDEEMKELLDKAKTSNISIVSCVANSKDSENRENHSFIQGLEKLSLAMQGERYTGIIIANGTNQEQLANIRKGYESIYTKLSPFAKSQVNYSYNNSINQSQAFSKGISLGTSYTESTSSTNGSSESNSISNDSTASKTAKGVAVAANVLGVALMPLTGGTSLMAGAIVSSTIGVLGTALQSTKTEGITTSLSDTEGTSTGATKSDTTTNTDTKGLTQGTGQSMTLNLEDKTISNTLVRLDTQLQRLQEFESLGMWECAAYFLSEKPHAAEIAASTYKALMRGENSGVEVSAINSWRNYEKNKVALLKEYALKLMHPVLQYHNSGKEIQVTPCTLVSGNELAIHMGLPKKSVCGFPVIEHADFGKEVVSYTHEESMATINLGNIFNMGSETNNHVRLDRNSMAMHTFITGSTGSGKSNTVYEILRQLDSVNVNYLVIEPAKGEYKNIFGHHPDVTVLGTNPAYTALLRINPFRFPKGVHVLEHIDRLIEIFNVCWPMYAAMPAVLKDAVLQAYEVCGWDLVESKNTVDEDLFPTFQDLLTELVDVIDNSAYHNEVKSNYKGSLETRVKSLTNGLNGQIFSTDEIGDKTLFDTKVIIDLSRIGSLETKALIMGILVMRLNEYRMTEHTGMNVPLKHVTVLEEAHNILKRTSTEQNPEGSNLAGKSVEMLSNAIAEMRTYGEGFIIADQSPSAVDVSAIRNTNTKIIMRLPDESDRRFAGKSAALKDEQLDEIAKLPKGVAVVYQNDWLEPVLCKVRQFSGSEKPYAYDRYSQVASANCDKWFKTELLKLLVKGLVVEQIDIDIDEMKENVSVVNLSTKNKIGIHHILNEYGHTGRLSLWEVVNFEPLSSLIGELLQSENKVNRFVRESQNFDELSAKLYSLIDNQTEDIAKEVCLAVSQCLMKNYSIEGTENIEVYSAWRETVKKRGSLL